MNKLGQHVVSSLRGGWSVRTTGAQKATRVFQHQADAIAFARSEAKRQGGEVFIHNEDGSVRDVRTYERRAG